MENFYYLPPHVLNKIFYLSSNYKENYDKVVSNLKFNKVLKEFKYHLSQKPKNYEIVSYLVLTRLKIINHIRKEDFYSPFYIYNSFQQLVKKQQEYKIQYEIKLLDIVGYLNLVL